MSVWSDTTPLDSALANTIHIGIQDTKADIMDRLRSYNGNNYEHVIFDSASTGRHLLSLTGFVKPFTNTYQASNWVNANHPESGCLLSTPSLLLLVTTDDVINVGVVDHGDLLNLSMADHPQYMDVNGVRVATADWSLTGSTQLRATTFGTEASDAMSSSHAALGGYAAHGSNSINQRHLLDGSVGLNAIAYSTSINSFSGMTSYVIDGSIGKYSGFPGVIGIGISVVTPIACWYSGGPLYRFTGATTVYVRLHTMRYGAST